MQFCVPSALSRANRARTNRTATILDKLPPHGDLAVRLAPMPFAAGVIILLFHHMTVNKVLTLAVALANTFGKGAYGGY